MAVARPLARGVLPPSGPGQRAPPDCGGSLCLYAYTPRQVCWLLLKAPADLPADEQASLTRLYHACPQVAVAEALVEEFGAVLRERDVEGLYTWLRGLRRAASRNCKGAPGVSGWIVRPSRRTAASTGATGR